MTEILAEAIKTLRDVGACESVLPKGFVGTSTPGNALVDRVGQEVCPVLAQPAPAAATTLPELVHLLECAESLLTQRAFRRLSGWQARSRTEATLLSALNHAINTSLADYADQEPPPRLPPEGCSVEDSLYYTAEAIAWCRRQPSFTVGPLALPPNDTADEGDASAATADGNESPLKGKGRPSTIQRDLEWLAEWERDGHRYDSKVDFARRKDVAPGTMRDALSRAEKHRRENDDQ